jgi:hypothetical protein
VTSDTPSAQLRPFNVGLTFSHDLYDLGEAVFKTRAIQAFESVATRYPIHRTAGASQASYIYRYLIYLPMLDEAMLRLLDYHRRRYWLTNGWSIRFQIVVIEQSAARPHGIKYSFTLHDVDGTRLLGFDNAHGIPRQEAFDHKHRFREPRKLLPYEFRGADELISDFFAAVERACELEGVAFEFDSEDVELDLESDDDEKVSD